MNTMEHLIGPMKKVCLTLTAGTRNGSSDLTPAQVPFEFVFGVGTAGMTPFEYALLNKRAGETIDLTLTPNHWHETFEHLALPLPEALRQCNPVHLSVTVASVGEAQAREIVRAMAHMSSCGSGCGCGCGGDAGGCG